MLSGLYPFRTGVRENHFQLHDDVETLPEILRAAGYHTAGFVSNFTLLGKMSGLAQGFDVYDDRFADDAGGAHHERPARQTLEAILSWVRSAPKEPFFLFINFIDPHGPYTPPEEFRDLFRSGATRTIDRRDIPDYQLHGDTLNFHDYEDRYDAEIRYADWAIGSLIEEMKGRGLWEESLVVFAGDHGEALGSHGVYFRHALYVYDETVRVPMAIRLPADAPGPRDGGPARVAEVCSPIDLMPTVLDLTGLKAAAQLDGQSLLAALRGDSHGKERQPVFLEYANPAGNPSAADLFAVRATSHKMVRTEVPRTGQNLGDVVYDVGNDPEEIRPIPYDSGDPVHARLARRLDRWIDERRAFNPPFPVVEYRVGPEDDDPGGETRGTLRKRLTPEEIEQLRSLGYIR
jgi:arylsulfatase A-like enzyme